MKQGFATMQNLRKRDVVAMDFLPDEGTSVAVRNKPMSLMMSDNF